MDSHIFLLHGLGAHTITLLPLELALNYMGWYNTHKISYPVDHFSFEHSVDYVYHEITKVVKDEPVILIGQSMGGVVANALHERGIQVRHAIYIGSPLHGANLLNQLERILPTSIRDFFYKRPYDFLKSKDRALEPPHSYNTISMGWTWSTFDGCVYRNEATLDNSKNHHLAWMDHRTGFANPRLWKKVIDILAVV